MAILTVNSGSSSLKFGLYADDGSTVLLNGEVQGIAHAGGAISLKDGAGSRLAHEERQFASQDEAMAAAAELLRAHGAEPVTAVGHRMVHGGPHLREHCALTDDVLHTLEQSVHFAPLHIPPALALVRATERDFPEARQFTCFDTAFHRTMPPEASTYAIPRAFRDAGVQRYGFHGLSYASLARQLGLDLKPKAVAAHLGGGSSLCALAGGRSVDTSMGASPCGGGPMATRSGDLDPGVTLLMQRGLPGVDGLAPDKLEATLNHASGTLALADESDMRVLEQRREAGDAAAQLAFAVFTRAVAKTVASYAAVLDGLDQLIFTGGMGEGSAAVRGAVCARLGWLGVALEPGAQGPVLSAAGSSVEVRVVPADEDGEIAREVVRLLAPRC